MVKINYCAFLFAKKQYIAASFLCYLKFCLFYTQLLSMALSIQSPIYLACFLLATVFNLNLGLAQNYSLDNLNRLVNESEEGKTYYTIKVAANTPGAIREAVGYQIKLCPPRFREYYDTIVIAPALNGNLDTSNYFIQTEILVLREPAMQWKAAEISKLCIPNTKTSTQGVCLLKTTYKYEIVHTRFYPYKNILDTQNTDFVIPAELKIVKRYELLEPTRISHHPLNEKVELKMGEKLIVITEGYYNPWSEATCPYGVFNDPDVRKIQQALIKEGYKLKETGDYDEPTKRMLTQFQLDHQLPDEGINTATLKRLGIEPEKLIQIVD